MAELVNSEEALVTLVINATNLHVGGYLTGDQFYYFNDSTADTSILDKVNKTELPFGSSYADLEKAAGKKREEIPLGITALDKSIEHLHHYRGVANVASSLIVVIQMVSEAVRFRYIEYLVASSIGADGCQRKFYPTGTMISLQNNWSNLSTSIQRSIGGVLDPAVELVGREDEPVSVDSVNKYLINNIAVMLFVCNNPNQLSSTTQVDHVMGINDDHNCSNITEPTIRISGRNGRCLDAEYSTDDSGITLEPCNSNVAHQLWTLKTDGTIRSIGICMDAKGDYIGADVVTHKNCSDMARLNKWLVSDDGTIINRKSASGLVLTSIYGSSSTEVTTNKYDSRQGWLLSNNTEPIMTPIVGFKDLCLQANDENTVSIEECVSNKTAQEWAIYAEGTVRPNGNKDNCLTLESENVVIDTCNAGTGQRWRFKNDGSISNVATGLVMDVKDSDEIIVSSFNGTANQIWQAWLL